MHENPADLVAGLSRHGIPPSATFEELVGWTYGNDWAFQLWGAPWRGETRRFTCQLFAQQVDRSGRLRARHLLREADSDAAWVAEGATARVALGRALVMTLDVLEIE